MGIFDGIKVSEGAMSVHRLRSEVAAQNIANVYTPGYQRQVVDVKANPFTAELDSARSAGDSGNGGSQLQRVGFSGIDAQQGAIQVTGVRTIRNEPFDERQRALMGTTDMMRAKSAFELNVKAATLLKSMALSSLEIGRGS